MIKKMLLLNSSLKHSGFIFEANLVNRLIKIASIPGIDSPVEELDIDGVSNAIKYLLQNPGRLLYLDQPKGSYKWSVDGEMRPMPFHYGEVIDISNPSDGMGWDVVIAPESTDQSQEDGGVHYIPEGHQLSPVGYVPVNPDEATWARNTASPELPGGKPPPIGNDKIILAPGGVIRHEDKKRIESFFGDIWSFTDVVWL